MTIPLATSRRLRSSVLVPGLRAGKVRVDVVPGPSARDRSGVIAITHSGETVSALWYPQGVFSVLRNRLLVIVVVLTALAPFLARSGSLAQEATPAAQGSPSGPAHLEGDLPGDPQVQLIQIATGLQTPTNIAFPPDDSGRIFVVEETGTIHIVNSDGSVEPEPFLDLSNTVSQRPGQQGLMGLAFHPDFANNHRLYVDYNNLYANGEITIS